MSKILRKVNCPENDYIRAPVKSDPNRQPLIVYLLNTKKSIKIAVSKRNTIEEIIRHVIYLCLHGNYKNKISLPYDSAEGI